MRKPPQKKGPVPGSRRRKRLPAGPEGAVIDRTKVLPKARTLRSCYGWRETGMTSECLRNVQGVVSGDSPSYPKQLDADHRRNDCIQGARKQPVSEERSGAGIAAEAITGRAGGSRFWGCTG